MREVKLVQGTAARMRTTATEPNRATRPKQKAQDGSPSYNFWCGINDVPLIIDQSINRPIVLHFNTASRIGMIFLIPANKGPRLVPPPFWFLMCHERCTINKELMN